MAHYRTIFISDVHLGTRTAQAEMLLDFLRDNEADTYYLVGDIIDFWRIKRGAVWPQSHNDVLQKLLRKVRKGARMVFLPGNHDEGLRAYCGSQFGGITRWQRSRPKPKACRMNAAARITPAWKPPPGP